MKTRVVFDCMIFLQAVARPVGPAGACVDRAENGDAELLVSADILAEMRDVLNRPGVQKKFRNLTPERVANFIIRIERFAVVIGPVPEAFTLARYPKDSKYLNLAIVSGAELVVSRDNDLLDLMTSDDAEPTAFRTAYPTIRIIDPVAFLRTFPPTDSSKTDPTTANPDEAL